MDQDPQGLWMGPKGPPDGAKGSSPLQELEKARKVGYFSRVLKLFKCIKFQFFSEVNIFGASDNVTRCRHPGKHHSMVHGQHPYKVVWWIWMEDQTESEDQTFMHFKLCSLPLAKYRNWTFPELISCYSCKCFVCILVFFRSNLLLQFNNSILFRKIRQNFLRASIFLY